MERKEKKERKEEKEDGKMERRKERTMKRNEISKLGQPAVSVKIEHRS